MAEPPYDVCLSFAGEQRDYVEEVAERLRERGVRVFYDKFEQATLWGKDLYEHLDWVYRKSARYCVLFASSEYATKMWTGHERRSAQARAVEENEEYILPTRFDDTEIPGLPPTVGYQDLRKVRPTQLAELIQEKLGYSIATRTVSYDSAQAAVSLAKRGLTDPQAAVDLHDLIRKQAERVRNLRPVISTEFNVTDTAAEYKRRVSELESGIETLTALVATCAYWGSENTDRWWFGDIGRFAHLQAASGSTALINLTVAPAVFLLYAAGVGATAAERWKLVGRLLGEPKSKDIYSGTLRSVAALYGPSEVLSVNRASLHLHDFLAPILADHMSIGSAAFSEAWERFEYLRLLANTDDVATNGGRNSGGDIPHIRAIDTPDREYQPSRVTGCGPTLIVSVIAAPCSWAASVAATGSDFGKHSVHTTNDLRRWRRMQPGARLLPVATSCCPRACGIRMRHRGLQGVDGSWVVIGYGVGHGQRAMSPLVGHADGPSLLVSVDVSAMSPRVHISLLDRLVHKRR